MLPRNRVLSELCSNELNSHNLSLGKIVYRVGWCKMCLNTITLFRFRGKTQFLAVSAIFPTKAEFGGGACTYLKHI